MRYISLAQSVTQPSILQICYGGSVYSMMLHGGFLDSFPGRQQWEMASPGSKLRLYDDSNKVYRIWLCTDGQISVHSGKTRLSVRRGSLILHDPGKQPLHIYPHDGDTFNISVTAFSLVSHDGKLLRLPFAELIKQWTGEPIPDIADLMQLTEPQTRQLESLLTQHRNTFTPDKHLRLFGAHRTFLDIVISLMEIFLREWKHPANSPVLHARNLIESRYAEDLSLALLSREVKLNPRYLTRVFGKMMGMSPTAYLQHIRIDEAKRLLLNTDMRINEIGKAVGFRSVHYFSRVFHREAGVSPTAFRQRLLSTD